MAKDRTDVQITDNVTPAVKRLLKDYPGIGNFIANQAAEGLAEYVVDRKLSGQVLSVRTGETRGSTTFYKIKEGMFGVRPGVGIRGSLNYLIRFERGGRPFMGPAYREYSASGQPEEIARSVLASVHKERGF